MSKVAIRNRWTSSPRRGFHVGLLEQLALTGISGVIVTGAICTVARSTGAWRNVSRMPATNSKVMSYRCHKPSWNPGKLQPNSSASPVKNRSRNMPTIISASSQQGFVTDLRDDDPMKEATSLRSVINLYAHASRTWSRPNETLASTRIKEFKASYEWPCAQLSIGCASSISLSARY